MTIKISIFKRVIHIIFSPYFFVSITNSPLLNFNQLLISLLDEQEKYYQHN